jgi:hypothetical protein
MDAKTGALAALRMSRGLFNQLIADFPADKAAFQPCPTDNHLLWFLGHMPFGYAYFAQVLGGKITDPPEAWKPLFGPGSKPEPDAKKYPPIAELKASFDRTFDEFLAIVEKMPVEDLAKPPAISADWLPNRLAALHAVIWHEGWHGGQLASVRKALGLPNVMG